MALVTLVLLLIFCAPPLRAALSHPPGWLVRVADELAARRDPAALWALAYALVSIFLTPFFVTGTLDVLVRVLAGVILLLLALPDGAPQLVAALNRRTATPANEAIMESLTDIIAVLARAQKLLAYVGVFAAVLLFAVLFR